MKVSAFTICRNAVSFDYPIVEVIRSALPIVDEFIVNVGQSEDGTRELIRSIGSDKVRILDSVWDDSMKQDGLLFSYETNKALARCTGDWALYLQADEVLHEADHDVIRRSLREHLGNPAVLGFTFRYLHFYGDYRSVHPWFYHRAVRIIRNDGQVESCGDAVGFWLKADQGWMQSVHKDRLRPSGATVYHYGWVKQPRVLLDKFRYQVARHHGDNPGAEQARMLAQEAYRFEDYDIMKNFTGSHPAVMRERVSRYPVLKPGRNRWLEPAFYRAIVKRGFRG
ncbi:MAG: glycosyltransferase family 2 protein [Nitrospirota bacterium]|nr:glycosyltransferase family 2 protein [Nitrospirota bacterium]